jgi:hypothetical protein
MGIEAELKTVREKAAGDPAAVEAAVRRVTSIRDVLAGARAAAGPPDVRAALEDSLARAEEALAEVAGLAPGRSAAEAPASGPAPGGPGPSPGGAASGGSGSGPFGGKRPAWPPSGEVIGQAAEGLEKLAAGVTTVLGQLARELSKAADEFGRSPARCRKCGTALGDARFCPRCGTARG